MDNQNPHLNSADPREPALFAAALARPPTERAAFLDGACHGNPALRARLETQLAAQEGPVTVLDTEGSRKDELHGRDEFHESPSSGQGLTELGPPVDASDEAVGQTLGPRDRLGAGRYKLLERIGEGGCGVVYAAEQTEPVRRRVAVKVIKLGMDTKQVVARFEAERQALAMMDHPNIAKVLDAGMTGPAESSAGRPYFVMELVRGIRITDYCDQANLNTKERLELFIKVCQAIQHAHQKGIIHRDIKPSNILVTLHDGVPVPKVIDFGIAKATEGRLTDSTVYTQVHQFMGTPAYMSPEQAEMSGLDIDTRSDIYSLGVLLYELLAGCTPFDAKELIASGIDAMRKTIREKEPQRPSTRLTQELTVAASRESAGQSSGQAGGELTSRRYSRLKEALPQIRGDLDWIAMKCLEKDRQRRYDTANGLAADLQRHLNNEPVVARPPSPTYRLQKLVLRNKLAFAATAAIAAALTIGAVIGTWQAIRARRAERLAIARLADSEAITRFLTQVFESPDPARDGRTITVAESLGRAAAKLEADLGTQPARRAQLQTTLGVTYQALSLYGEAVTLLEKVLNHHRSASGPEHPDTLEAMLDLGTAYFNAGRWNDAARLDEEALPLFRKVKGDEHPDTLRAMVKLAACYDRLGRTQEAFALKEKGLSLTRKVRGPEHADTLTAANNMAYLYSQVGRHQEAISLQEEVLALRRKVSGPKHPATIWAVMNLGLIYREGGRLEDALKAGQLCVDLFRAGSGLEHRDTLNAMTELAMTQRALGRLDEAIALEEDTLKLKRQHLPVGHPMTLESMEHLATCYEKAGRKTAATRLREEVAELRAKPSPNKPAQP